MEPSNLENHLAALHGNVFFREFSFFRTQFKPNPRQELEFADQVVYCGTRLLIYQLKERHSPAIKDQETEETWFDKKVLKSASSQIRDTLRYLGENGSIELTNQRGHSVDLVALERTQIHKVIIYRTTRPDLLPTRLRYKISKSAGFIHVFSSDEYESICDCLYTPAEISEYLEFRERILSGSHDVSELAILGQFVSERTAEEPAEEFSGSLSTFVNDVGRFSIRDIVSIFEARIVNDGGHPQEYYKILTVLSTLSRSALRCFVERFSQCVTNAKEQRDPFGPTLFYCDDCGFVFFVPPKKLTQEQRLFSLANITEAAKHHGKTAKQIGVSFAWDLPSSDWLIDWCYMESPWEPGPQQELEEVARRMFPPLREAFLPRYLHVKETEVTGQQVKHGKIGRNELCHCGSNKKFKKCHGN